MGYYIFVNIFYFSPALHTSQTEFDKKATGRFTEVSYEMSSISSHQTDNRRNREALPSKGLNLTPMTN